MAAMFSLLRRIQPCDSTRLLSTVLTNCKVLAGSHSAAAEHVSPDKAGQKQQVPVADARVTETRADKLEEQLQDLSEKYQKALVDCDTVRRKTQKFVEDAKLFGIQSFCRDLVEVADLLEKTSSKLQVESNLSGELAEVRGRLQSIFSKHGLEKMRPLGGSYDPYQHEIVCHVLAEDVKPGNVAVVKLDGYQLHGRTIRHAHVGIALEGQE